MRYLIISLAAIACAVQAQAANTLLDDGSEAPDVSQFWFKDEEGNPVLLDPKNTDESEAVEVSREDVADRIQYYLFTPRSRTYLRREQLYVDDSWTLRRSKFDSSRPTRIITHGWSQSTLYDVCTSIRDAYLKEGNYNIILVDWSIISMSVYGYAQERVQPIGKRVAQFIEFLERNGMDLSTTILIGHGLGAHIVGLAGHHTTNEVGYVVGLDPAGPLFLTASAGSRISQGDAKVVQIIHTNGGRLGLNAAVGDIDFYPNGGTLQSGCLYDLTGACDHNRSYEYFAESINGTQSFLSKKCISYMAYSSFWCNRNEEALMGGSSPVTSSEGSFYLDTNWRSPYAKG